MFSVIRTVINCVSQSQAANFISFKDKAEIIDAKAMVHKTVEQESRKAYKYKTVLIILKTAARAVGGKISVGYHY